MNKKQIFDNKTEKQIEIEKIEDYEDNYDTIYGSKAVCESHIKKINKEELQTVEEEEDYKYDKE
jgi:hypothetical protein